MAEAKTVARLIELGYTVSKPVSEDSRYDVIADDGENLHRLQVKHGRRKEGSLLFNTSDMRGVRGEPRREGYEDGSIDAFVAYDPEGDDLYWVPLEDAPDTEMRLRIAEVSKTAPVSQINWAEDYTIPPAR